MTDEIEVYGAVPAFEGHVVEGVRVRIQGVIPADVMDSVVVGIDDVVQMLTQYKCVAVRHAVDEKTGRVVREHVLKPLTAELHPFDDGDDGVVRAMEIAKIAKGT